MSMSSCEGTAAPSLSEHAASGYQEGGDNYDKFRPSYTPKTVSLVASEILSTKLGVKPHYKIIELGAGTGKFTELLAPHLPPETRYLALEPSEDFCRVLKAKNLNIETCVGQAAAIPAADASVESIVCAEAFHWFADTQHLKEIHRVLIPGGNLIIVYNFRDYSKGWMVDFYNQRVRVHQRIGDSLKHVVFSMEWHKDISESPLFTEVMKTSLPGICMSGSVEDILEHTKTQQGYKNLPEDELHSMMDELRNILMNWPGLDPQNIIYPFVSKVFLYRAK